jgi:hypothetical protein
MVNAHVHPQVGIIFGLLVVPWVATFRAICAAYLKESVMPDSTIPAPVAADAIDRLTLGATDARSGTLPHVSVSPAGYNAQPICSSCMAEE